MVNLANPWQARFGWIWFNEKEIFHDTDEDTFLHVKSFYDQGINILIGFSCTHFRMSFSKCWDKINDCIERYARACHKLGMLYVEHHSTHLVWHPISDADMVYYRDLFNAQHSDPAHFPGLIEEMTGDEMVGKYKMSELYQISGETGEAGRTRYSGYGMCFNNPYYREVYFKYLEDVYKRGIDGLMTDDVQFFGNDTLGRWNACTCEHCRRLFTEETGLTLPEPDKWNDFYGNYDDPVFVAWKKFKVESTTRFQRDVNRHFESLGYNFIRPNYISEIVRWNITAYPFEKCSELWDYIFQENCSFYIIRNSFPMFFTEAVHRFAMARQRGVPSMSMFYPCTESQMYLSFALAKAWGQLYTKSKPVFDKFRLDETRFRDFEKKYAGALENPKKKSDLAFLISTSTRDYTAGGGAASERLISWMQAAMFSGLDPDMVFEWGDDLENFGVIAAVCAEMLPDSTVENLKSFVRGGGKLIAIGDFASLDDTGADGRARVSGFLPPEGSSQSYGEGEVVRINDADFMCGFCDNIYEDVNSGAPMTSESPMHALKETCGRALCNLICRKAAESDTEDLVINIYETDEGEAIHIVNLSGVIAEKEKVSHLDEIPAFLPDAEKLGEIRISAVSDFKPEKLVFVTPESDEEKELGFDYDGRLTFTVPEGSFSGYGLVRVLKKS